MITDTLDPVAPPAQKRCNLLLHCGSSAVSRGELAQVKTPKATSTWQPIPHLTLLQVVEKALLERGFTIVEQAHGLTHDQSRYFGLLQVVNHHPGHQTHKVVGVRNSHDQSFSAGVVAGSQVLVCSNLSFAGEIAVARKHTPRILHDLPRMTHDAIVGLTRYWSQHEQRIARYQQVRIADVRAHDLVIRAVDHGVMANSYIPKVLQEYREPRHREFKPRTVWSLQNAFTEVFKGRVDLLPERSARLHQLLDYEVGLN
ncbi:DUF932 domain-containing protein [Coraliomargarita parva]|uniref:DUF932 domain-containing protein n=1 Tax=Coraliomargarita parva TaxID=3014050 RepID=UPI0022B46884|nr:DUF932 domain-containing protein [Coraliomargarita parva]